MGLVIASPTLSEELPTNKGWSDFGKWAASIAKTYPRIGQLWQHGITGTAAELAQELDHALSQVPPQDPTVHETAENILRVAQASGNAEYVAVTNGIVEDQGGEDETDEEAADYDPDGIDGFVEEFANPPVLANPPVDLNKPQPGEVSTTPPQSVETTGPPKTFATNAPPGPPPRPGLEWKPSTHRWVHPDSGEEHEHVPPGHVPDHPDADHLAPEDVDAIHEAGNAIATELAGDSPGMLGRIRDAAIGGIARSYLFLMKHHDKLETIGNALGVVFDLPSDLRKFGYEPTSAGAGPQTTSDPTRQHLGIGTHLAATLASKSLAAAWATAKRLLTSPKQLSSEMAAIFAELGGKPGDWLDVAVELLAGLFADANAEYGLEGGIDPAKIRAGLEVMVSQ